MFAYDILSLSLQKVVSATAHHATVVCWEAPPLPPPTYPWDSCGSTAIAVVSVSTPTPPAHSVLWDTMLTAKACHSARNALWEVTQSKWLERGCTCLSSEWEVPQSVLGREEKLSLWYSGTFLQRCHYSEVSGWKTLELECNLSNT